MNINVVTVNRQCFPSVLGLNNVVISVQVFRRFFYVFWIGFPFLFFSIET